MKNWIFLSLFFCMASESHAFSIVGGTESLPKGVRAFQFNTLDISVPGAFDRGGSIETYGVQAELKVNDIISVVPQAEILTKRIEKIDPQLASELSLGEIEIEPNVTGSGQVFGLGWGITDRLMIGVGAPYLKVKVDLNAQYKSSNSLKLAAQSLGSKSKNLTGELAAEYAALSQILDNLPTLTAENLQSYLVSEFNYAPLGTWEGSGFGDTQAFIHYLFNNTKSFKQAIRWGFIFPTGRKDDPDNLTDTGFTYGAQGSYLELRNDWKVFHRVMVSGAVYYEQFLPSKKEIRLIDEFPLATEKETVKFRRGERLEPKLGIGFELYEGLKLYAQQAWSYKSKDEYTPGPSDFNYASLSEDTSSEAIRQVVGLSYTTVPLYLRSKIFLPFKLDVHHSQVAEGKFENKIDYTSLELQLYF